MDQNIDELVDERKIRRKRRRRRRSPRKIKNYEDNNDEYDELERLQRTGIRNKKNTVELFRILVRTTDYVSRLNLLKLMINADSPCKRLFIDYQVLKILSGKFSDLGFGLKDLDMKLTVEDLLSRLPIPNRTMLDESKIWHIVSRWAKANNEDEMAQLEAEDETSPSCPSSPSNNKTSSPAAAAAIDPVLLDRVAEIAKLKLKQEDEQQQQRLPQEEPAPIGDDVPTLPIIKKEDEEVDIDPAVRETVNEMIATVISGQSEVNTGDDKKNAECVDEKAKAQVEPVQKAHLKAEDEQREIEAKIKTVKERAERLLDEWKLLKEQFRIPKKLKSKLRAEHERAADQAAEATGGVGSGDSSVNNTPSTSPPFPMLPSAFANPSASWKQGNLTYSQYQQQQQKFHFAPFSKANENNHRLSRFDDTSGLLHRKDLEVSQTHRRNFIRTKREIEAREKVDIEQRMRAHADKCKYLSLNPEMTPFFDEYPEYHFDFGLNKWIPMPPPTHTFTPFKNNMPLPRMAVLPLEAFRPGERVESNRRYYPPGVVEDSTMFEAYFNCNNSEDDVNMNVEQQDHQEPQHDDVASQQQPPPKSIDFLSSEVPNEIPFLDAVSSAVRGPEKRESEFDDDKCLEQPDNNCSNENNVAVDMDIIKLNRCSGNASSSSSTSSSRQSEPPPLVIRLPPNWNVARDCMGNVYYYNSVTRESQWEPPVFNEEDYDEVEDDGEETVEMETASPENNDDKQQQQQQQQQQQRQQQRDEDTDDEDEEDEQNNVQTEKIADDLASDLSAQEKELLLTRKRRSKAERRFERKQKKERDREKREYERKRRRERHGKHRRNGLVKEHLIPVSLLITILLHSLLLVFIGPIVDEVMTSSKRLVCTTYSLETCIIIFSHSFISN